MKNIYYHGKVYTGSLPLAEAFIEENGRFVYAGSDDGAKALAQSGDRLVDLEGRFVCSGFIDSHMHLLNYGQSLSCAQLAEHTDSIAGLVSYFSKFAKEHPPMENGWLMGRGWNQDYFTDEKRMPNRYDLDLVSTEFPVYAVRACGHCLAVNSKALEILGITAETPVPEGGRIGMENGVPDGLFFDNAMDLVYGVISAPTKEEVKQMIRTACKALNGYGITGCHSDDFCVFHNVPWQQVKEAFEELEAAKELTVRVYEQSNFTQLSELKKFVEAGNVTGSGSDLYKIGPLKLLGDGALGAGTAFLSRPYADDPATCGLPVFSKESLGELIDYANACGMQVAVHAIGDACLDWVLEAFEKALIKHPRKDHRHGIVHCQITRPDQLRKIEELDLHVYAQSIFLDYDIHMVEQRVGKELASTSYNWKTLMKNGVSVSNGSDCPVELPDALAGIQCAVTRTTLKDHIGPWLPAERFTVQEALDSYTVRSAEASFEEEYKGQIKKGMLADFVILGGNPFEAAQNEIKDIPVCATYLGGRKVYG
ncbi:MAG: amidohydrolase [Lachnospiraceae bacterium]|nr:amidohydrolase [Lachnospiraceae bacterium]